MLIGEAMEVTEWDMTAFIRTKDLDLFDFFKVRMPDIDRRNTRYHRPVFTAFLV